MEDTIIPKIIHFCWFGGRPLPKSAKRCIESWKKYLPDFEIKRWDESNFNINEIEYISEAYSAGKYAFVSDYARLKILWEYGGLYFDTDVEIIRPIDDIISKGPFLGIESLQSKNGRAFLGVNPGLGLSAIAGMNILKKLLDTYAVLHFINQQGNLNKKTIVEYTSEELVKHGLKPENKIQQCGGFTVYPIDYFNPKDMHSGKIIITGNTRSIHHFDSSWHTPWERFKKRLSIYIGPSLTKNLVNLKRCLKLKRVR